jgi:hypothetical protein
MDYTVASSHARTSSEQRKTTREIRKGDESMGIGNKFGAVVFYRNTELF